MTLESDLKLILSREEKTMLSIYEELSNQISTLEELVLSKAINEFQIPAILIYSLGTENPIYTMNEFIRIIRYKQAKVKVISYASKLTKMNEIITDGIILTLIKDTPYFKNRVRLQSHRHGIL